MDQGSHRIETTRHRAALSLSIRADNVLARLAEAWPERLPRRDIAGLPSLAFDALPVRRSRPRLAVVAAHLDRHLPGWPERAAADLAAAASGVLSPDLRRLSAVLAQRPVRRHEDLVRALRSAPHADTRLWLLTALSGTDTSAVRAFWLDDLRARVRAEPPAPDPALWFAFLRALLGAWLTFADFRDCLVLGRVPGAAHPRGEYGEALVRLGLDAHPTFSKWYRQVVYEVSHQPDVGLSYRSGGWIRDFPGEEYLWEALDHLSRTPDSWWALHVLRWASGVNGDDQRVVSRLGEVSAIALCELSLLRPDLCRAAACALQQPYHETAVKWLKTASPGLPLDLRALETQLRPWADQTGNEMTVACGALCSVELPGDYPGSEHPALRRREFVSGLMPQFDRVMDNICCLHALRKEHFDVICRLARAGRPMGIRSLALWPEKAEESAPLLFRLGREGTKPARRAAREALDILRARMRVQDLADFERRLDLASAWADFELEGRASRIWWDVGGYRLRLSVTAGNVSLQAFRGERPLSGIPRAVRDHSEYEEVRHARAELARSYRYFRRRFEDAMIEGVRYRGRDFAVLLANPVVRSLVSRLVVLVDGKPQMWTLADPFAEHAPPVEMRTAAEVRIAHPLDLSGQSQLADWQQRVVDSGTAQPFKQVFRELYVLGERELGASSSARFAGAPLVARRAFALLRSRGYSPGQGDAAKAWASHSVTAHIRWANPQEDAGRLLARQETAETVTSGAVSFVTNQNRPIPLAEVDPIVLSETLRDADLLVSRAAAGELGFTSEETLRLRATMVRYLCRVLGMTTIYVAEDARHALVEGKRAMYRVHLGSGSVFLEESRRHLDLGSVASKWPGDVMSESLDSVTARVLAVIAALARDDQITDPEFLSQL